MVQKISSIRMGQISFGIIVVALASIFYFSDGSRSDKINKMSPITEKKELLQVTLTTSKGEITIELFESQATNTVKNFVSLVENKFFDGTKFHRVIKNFMIQGGDPLSKGSDSRLYGRGGPGYAFDDEINNQKVVRGVIAMANSGPNTNGSQFFIVTAVATPWLDGKHTVFGRVIKGMEVIDKIESAKTGQNDVPIEPVIVEKIMLK